MPTHVIAHRGDSAARPENTLCSFAAALEAGAEIVELDVQLTRDGHAVVIHDPTLDRTTNGRGRVAETTLAELRALSAGFPARFGGEFSGERVPTLAEALELLRERAQVLIEIKREASSGAPDGVEARTIAAVHKAGVAGEVALACFDPAVLQRCRACDPSVARAHLFHRAPVDDALGSAAAVAATFILPEKGMLSPELVERASAAGLRVATWLIDDPDELLALKPYALYGVGTNRPAAMLEALAEA